MTWFQMESEVNDMSPKNDFSDIFDDDFEVTYEEDPEINFHTSEDTKQINRPNSNTETIVMNADDYRDNFNDSDDSQFEEVLPEYDDDYEDDDADYEDDYNDDYEKKPKVNRREVRRTSDYSNSVNEEKRYGLINGSDEYWEYKDTAEKIYWDFCEARTTDARRMYKQEGEALKRKMISKYGADDESVKTIIERFLDLRV